MADITPRCRLLELPPELLITLAEFLNPASKVLLSFACKRLHDVLNILSKKELSTLSDSEYDDYLSAMVSGIGLHDRFACVCHRLHNVEAHDFPGVTRGLAWNGCWPASAKLGSVFTKYCLHQRHIQLALRSSSSGAQNARLTRILRPFRERGNSVFNPCSWEFSAQPLIAQGNFMVHINETFEPLYNSHITMGQCQFIKICPHIMASPRWSADTAHYLLRQHLEQIIEQQGSQTDGYCTRCATEFSLRSTDTGLEIDIWYDFGSDPSPSSPSWISHVSCSEDGFDANPEVIQHTRFESADETRLRRMFNGALKDVQSC